MKNMVVEVTLKPNKPGYGRCRIISIHETKDKAIAYAENKRKACKDENVIYEINSIGVVK